MVFAPHFAVNQTDPCQPTVVRWMRPDHQRELPGNVFLAYCLLPKKKTSVYSPFCCPKWLGLLWWSHTFFTRLFFVQDSSRWLKCCSLYIYSMWSSHSSAWSQCEWTIWHWYRTADKRLLIGYSTLNKDISSLISILFFVPSMWYLDHCFSSAVGSRLVWVHWMLGFKRKGLCFAFAARDKLWSVLDVLLETSARGRSTLGMRVCTTLRRSEGFVVYISQCNDF